MLPFWWRKASSASPKKTLYKDAPFLSSGRKAPADSLSNKIISVQFMVWFEALPQKILKLLIWNDVVKLLIFKTPLHLCICSNSNLIWHSRRLSSFKYCNWEKFMFVTCIHETNSICIRKLTWETFWYLSQWEEGRKRTRLNTTWPHPKTNQEVASRKHPRTWKTKVNCNRERFLSLT